MKKCDLIHDLNKQLKLTKKSIEQYLTYDITIAKRKEYSEVLENISKMGKITNSLNVEEIRKIAKYLKRYDAKVAIDLDDIKKELASGTTDKEDIKAILSEIKNEEVEKEIILPVVETVEDNKKANVDEDKKKKDYSPFAYFTGGVIGTLIIVGLLSHMSKDVTKDNNIETIKEKEEEIAEVIEVIDKKVDINNPESLYRYAQEIKDALQCNLSVEQIMDAIKLANYNILTDNQNFINSYEDVYAIMPNLGYLVANEGFDKIVLNDNYDLNISESYFKEMIQNVAKDEIDINVFASAKENDQYNIFKVLDILVNAFKNNENSKSMSKLYNEIFVNVTNTATICQNENNEFYFTLMALYNETSKTLKDDYLGPIYGDGERIDGTYGHTCNQALREYYIVGNENNAFYTFVIDNYFLDKAKVKQR